MFIFNKEKKVSSKHDSWNEDLAIQIAFKESIVLTSNHWKVIYTLRSLYLQFNIIPNLRILINVLRKKYTSINWNSIVFFELFPKGSIKQASNIAGLPQKNICL
ncbi:TusE/DsrC/DsvC family sulfur relay protein [Enterobacteriaceae endosymbiont of Donacia semicuprea]|uniref:TusE/DsrC/DsvC family sulfur relay protein n=1 Tax=Enterobacteriaceae endosymbiont of Donacia semicuprea TaxID=2675783 RepID=UPI0014491D23|nr:TusE/DsrC/DsvC family sulfur relay protein [Enterobacteriaceae endosymbiont of Donacia semicuprea]QJC32711.1 TusE/DsrC/DsvC family sulfur relay protein [Enterobacteriaceae endosymbiont of Donacia semicuprea]